MGKDPTFGQTGFSEGAERARRTKRAGKEISAGERGARRESQSELIELS
jgi:hypothetical protein